MELWGLTQRSSVGAAGMRLPKFKYHPDPVATGAVKRSRKKCCCCGQARGYICTVTMYSEQDVNPVCPWCVANGKAAEKFDGEFVDSQALKDKRLSRRIVREVSRCTPGYHSWQEPLWNTCCKDACEFHGSPSRDELVGLSKGGLKKLSRTTGLSVEELEPYIEHYNPGDCIEFYKFVCRHCNETSYAMEFD